jgi:hypothetical protein
MAIVGSISVRELSNLADAFAFLAGQSGILAVFIK